MALPLAIWLLPGRLDVVAALLAFAGGATGGLGLIAFYRAMSLSLIGVVAPITALIAAALPTSFYPAFTILCARLFLKERMSSIQVAGAVLAVVAVALIAAA